MITSTLIESYFPNLTELQKQQFAQLQGLYEEWNAQINVVSRKDIDLLHERHVLHSLGIAKVIQFKPQTKILDVGTGGGFPGIPLAILFPDCSFHLIDSIGKKIKVVKAVAEALQLKNVYAEQIRAEEVKDKFDFVVSRAVTAFPEFYFWVKNKIKITGQNSLPNGILYLKGGDLSEELKDFNSKIKEFPLSDYLEGEFFETKKVIYFKAN
ncbi:MAG: 16S rRNA (guanine(527)-N(7))-methyltransferase RsmG [Bacteroidetes bacterium]|nr:16S rRNA (guanine(527)-N(7))-methyltransferase RsmG [Bacteroidota bacterium]